jgi:hypothetical protein
VARYGRIVEAWCLLLVVVDVREDAERDLAQVVGACHALRLVARRGQRWTAILAVSCVSKGKRGFRAS